jgi:flagellar hook protein FlgE
MSLTGAMLSSASGMAAQANWLSLIGDNISNSGTTGYKEASAQFETVMADAGTSAAPSDAVNTVMRYNVAQQGVVETTTSPTDLAISGNGFFVVNDASGATYLTRAGAFVPNASGNLVNAAGYTLMGYSLQGGSAGVANGTAGLVPVTITQTGLSAAASTSGSLAANLPSSDSVVAAANLPSTNSATATYSEKTSLVTYNSLGTPVTLDVYMTNEGNNTWQVAVYNQADAASGGGFPYSSPALATQALQFDPTSGDLAAGSATSVSVAIPGGQTLQLDLSRMTQLDSGFSVANATVNGNAPSAFQQATISTDGTVSFLYADGTSVPVYRIPLANVASPDNLTTLPGEVYQTNSNSGQMVIGTADSGGLGAIDSSSLETSTVDLATELTNMIDAQHAYTANSKVFQTGSELMSVLEQLVNNG